MRVVTFILKGLLVNSCDYRELDAAAGCVPLLAGSVGPEVGVLTLWSIFIFVVFDRASVSQSDVTEIKRCCVRRETN